MCSVLKSSVTAVEGTENALCTGVFPETPSLELIYLPSHVLLHPAFHLLLRTFVSLKDIHFQWVYSIFDTSISYH